MAAPHVRWIVAFGGLLTVGRLLHLRRAIRSWPRRVAVRGRSMAPGLAPDDWLLVEPHVPPAVPRRGELVVVPDPRQRDRLLVKRVVGVEAEARLWLRGDAPTASTDSRTFGPVAASSVVGRPWFRYWPPRRVGRVR